jgi:integrase
MAREAAGRLYAQVKLGINPATVKDEARKPAVTFGAEVHQFLIRQKGKLRPKPYEEAERYLLGHCKALHSLPLRQVDRRAIADRLAEIESGSGPAARNRVRSCLSAFFNWMIREGRWSEANPVAATGIAEERNGGKGRERVLSDAELTEIWSSLGQDNFSEIIRLLLLTAQRRSEIGGLRWSEVEERDGLPVIVLPPARTKNGREHVLPLSPQAAEIVSRQIKRGMPGAERDCIFGNSREGFTGWSVSKRALVERINAARRKHDPKAAPIAQFGLHDVRRTCATVMHDRLNVQPHIVEAVLNHISGHRAGVAGVYNKAGYLTQMRAALDAWASYVLTVTASPVS